MPDKPKPPDKPDKPDKPDDQKRIYRIPVVVLYKLNGEFCAQLAHPSRSVPKDAVKKAPEGVNTVLGKWLDLGYRFGQTKQETPDFVTLPKGAEFIEVRNVNQVPFPY